MTLYYAETTNGRLVHTTTGPARMTTDCGKTIPARKRPPVLAMPIGNQTICLRCRRLAAERLWDEWRATLAAIERDDDGAYVREGMAHDALVDFVEAWGLNGSYLDPRQPTSQLGE